MPTAQSNGAPSTISSTNNNGGTMKANGGVSNTQLNANQVSNPDVGVYGSTVVEGLNKTSKAIAGGTFSHNHQRPLAFRTSTELAGVSSSALATAQNPSEWIHNKHPRNKVRTNQIATAIRNNQWNLYTGKWTVPPTVTNDPWYSISNAGGVANVADADKTVNDGPPSPGELTYVVGGQPSNDTYKPRTKW